MKLFHLYRIEDASGVSGTGPVVEGVQFTNGWCALRWMSSKSSVCFYQSLQDVKAVHGHGGKTELVIHDFEPLERRKVPSSSARFEVFLQIIEEASNLMNLAEEKRPDLEEIHEGVTSIRHLLDRFEKDLKKKCSRAA